MRRRLLAGGGAVLVAGAALGTGGAVAIEHLTSPGEVTTSQIAGAAQLVASECQLSTADGETVQTGTRAGILTIARKFGAMSCKVILNKGNVAEVTITESKSGINGYPTTFSFDSQSNTEQGKTIVTSWAFDESVVSSSRHTMNLAGYATTKGVAQAFVEGCPSDSQSLNPVCVPSIVVGGGNNAGPNLTTALFGEVNANAQAAMAAIDRTNQ